MLQHGKFVSQTVTPRNYFYNVPTEEMTTRQTLFKGHNEMIWLIVLGFLLFNHNDFNTSGHGETKNNWIFIALIFLLFTKTTC